MSHHGAPLLRVEVNVDKILRIKDVAKLLGVSDNKAYQMAAAGEIPAFKLAGKWRVREEALQAWLRKQASDAERSLGLDDFSEGMMR